MSITNITIKDLKNKEKTQHFNTTKNVQEQANYNLFETIKTGKDGDLELLGGKKGYSSQIRKKIDIGEFNKNIVNELKILGFKEQDIVENYIKLKHLTELYNNNMSIEILSFKELQTIIKSSRSFEEIKVKLKKIIDLDKYNMGTQVLIMSILD